MKLGELLKGKLYFERYSIKEEARFMMTNYRLEVVQPLVLGSVVSMFVFHITHDFTGFINWAILGSLFNLKIEMPDWLVVFWVSIRGYVWFGISFYFFIVLIKYYITLVRNPKIVQEAGILKALRYAFLDGGRLRLKYSFYIGLGVLLAFEILLKLSVLLAQTKEFFSNRIDPQFLNELIVTVHVGILVVCYYGILHLILLCFIVQDTTSTDNDLTPLSFRGCVSKVVQLTKGRKLDLLTVPFSMINGRSAIYILFVLMWWYYNRPSDKQIEALSYIIPYMLAFIPFLLPLTVIAIVWFLWAFARTLFFGTSYQLILLSLWYDQLTANDPDIVDFGE